MNGNNMQKTDKDNNLDSCNYNNYHNINLNIITNI